MIVTPDGERTTVPLVRLAWARSGDKGDHSNIGVIARRPDYLPYIEAALSAAQAGGPVLDRAQFGATPIVRPDTPGHFTVPTGTPVTLG